ncbi:MAG: hypothetical protein HYS07_08205 [Chlamydiae bacterium]|nr:hypothetical protein [Chlamydiota bacterium]
MVENQTDSDWKDVKLSLVSGRPLSFIQDLYQPRYIQRPVVEPELYELYANVKPQMYERGFIMDEKRSNQKSAPVKAQYYAINRYLVTPSTPL